MKRTQLSPELQTLLEKINFVSVATADGVGSPLNTPLYVVFDAEMHMYWASAHDAAHSRNISKRSDIFVAVYDTGAAIQEVAGLYLRMSAREVRVDEFKAALDTYNCLFGEEACASPYVGDCPRRLYAATPLEIFEYQASAVRGHFKDARTKIPAPDGRW